MKKVYVLFMTDQWHSDRSKKFLALSYEKTKLVGFAAHDASDREEKLGAIDRKILFENWQTQGRETNYIIEEHQIL